MVNRVGDEAKGTKAPSERLHLGREAEQRAAAWLEARGMQRVGSNVRVGRDELDLVMRDDGTLVAVEVRSAGKGAMVHPLETLNAGKKQRLRRALLRLAANRDERDVRIDFVAVTADGAIEWVPNAVDFTET